MARLYLDAVAKRFGATDAVSAVTLDIADGEFLVLLGPSGCGKSTLLRLIAGLEEPTAGRILLDGNDITDAPPQHRDLAMVFQSYALYPHLTVAKNIGFPLRSRRQRRADIDVKVREVASTLEPGRPAPAGPDDPDHRPSRPVPPLRCGQPAAHRGRGRQAFQQRGCAMSAPTNNLPVNGVATAHHVTELVAVLADSVLALAARVDRAPLSVRVAAGDLQIEVTWPHGEIALSDLHVASDARANGSGAAAPGRGTTTPRTLAEPASSAITRPAENGTATTVENGTATTVLPQSAAEPGTFVLCAATVGVFYRAPEPGAKPFVDEGDAVTPGRQVAIVEAMKMMIPVEAERAGLVAEFLVPDATSVEYGQPLILFREADR